MNRSGLIRKLDKLGRVSIPSELKMSLNLRDGDLVEFSVDGPRVVIEKYGSVCMICGGDKDVQEIEIQDTTGIKTRFKYCRTCALKIKKDLERGSLS